MLAAMAIVATACDPKTENPPVDVTITLMYENEVFAEDGITVTLTATDNSASYQAETAAGVATFSVLPGLYNATATVHTVQTVYNGTVAVTVSAAADNSYDLELTASEASQLLIKELYIGGCQKDDGSGTFMYDKYVILYNNGATELNISDVGLAFLDPFNSNSTNKYMVDGVLSYASQGWLPAGYAIWWFTSDDVILQPYSQVVIVIEGAIDNTVTYSNSVDLSDGSYYACYDPEAGFTNASRYPNPSANIPTSHYLNTFLYGKGNAWAISNTSPAFFILEYADIEAFSKNEANYDYTSTMPNVKVPNEWVVDGIEVYRAGEEAKNAKRFTPDIDAGYVYHTTKFGYTLYRNVDKAATEALPENEGKLVYNYADGTVGIDETYGTTDPSGIDAEASMANGAHIIYMDTNNSTNDFHQRRASSLKK